MDRRWLQAGISAIPSEQEAMLFISTVTQAEIELGIALLPDGKRKKALAAEAAITFEGNRSAPRLVSTPPCGSTLD